MSSHWTRVRTGRRGLCTGVAPGWTHKTSVIEPFKPSKRGCSPVKATLRSRSSPIGPLQQPGEVTCISLLHAHRPHITPFPALNSAELTTPSAPSAHWGAATLRIYIQNPLSTGSNRCPIASLNRYKAIFRASMNALEACASSVEAIDHDREQVQNRFWKLQRRSRPTKSSRSGCHGVQIGGQRRSENPYSMLVGSIWTRSRRRRPGSTRGTCPAVPQGDNVGDMHPFPGLRRGYVELM